MKDFIWSDHEEGKKPRLAYHILLLSKEEGGLSLISIKFQTIAMAGKTMLWIVADGDHTLQVIYRVKIGALSLHRWGTRDFAWLTSPCRTVSVEESPF